MRVQIRKTIVGIEYWDTEEKRTILVPNGVMPDFEITRNPISLIAEEITSGELDIVDDTNISSKDTDDDYKVDEELTMKKEETDSDDLIDQQLKEEDDGEPEDEGIDFASMTIKQLKEYASQNNIEIPSEVTLKDDIVDFISDAEMEQELLDQ